MDLKKVLTWIGNIEFEDGNKLSLGSIRTLGDLKSEFKSIQFEIDELTRKINTKEENPNSAELGDAFKAGMEAQKQGVNFMQAWLQYRNSLPSGETNSQRQECYLIFEDHDPVKLVDSMEKFKKYREENKDKHCTWLSYELE